VRSALLALAMLAAPAAGDDATRFEPQARERLLVVAPHPDDETLGAAGLIQGVLARGGDVRVVLLTAGDGYVEAVSLETGEPRPRPAEYVAYGERRLAEARAALRRLGGGRVRLQILGFPDGGLARLLDAHWSRHEPERSPTTAAERPPYPDVVSRSVTYDGDELRGELLHLLREAQPTTVALPDPLDHHPDHHATGVFTLLALSDFTREGAPLPTLLAYLVHWPAWPPGWDATTPDARAEAEPLALPDSLPERGLTRVAFALDGAERTGKRGALACYATQQEVTPALLAAFVRRTEPFTVLTAHEVRHAGDLVRPARR
jgi:LmbE family N-acetylglucosaminyl deacetylase